MQLHQLQPRTKRPAARQIGRGGKRGTTSGRGTKGQKARAGHRIRPEIRDQIKKLPKLRGHDFGLGRLASRAAVVKLARLSVLPATELITPGVLRAAGLIPAVSRRARIKILFDGTKLDRALRLRGCAVSAAARAAIEQAGGQISA